MVFYLTCLLSLLLSVVIAAPIEWTDCDAMLFDNGDGCHCDCGALDPDCLLDPVVIGCSPDQVCRIDGVCGPANATFGTVGAVAGLLSMDVLTIDSSGNPGVLWTFPNLRWVNKIVNKQGRLIFPVIVGVQTMGRDLEIESEGGMIKDSFNGGDFENIYFTCSENLVVDSSFGAVTGNAFLVLNVISSETTIYPAVNLTNSFNEVDTINIIRETDKDDTIFLFVDSFKNLRQFQSSHGIFSIKSIENSFQSLESFDVFNAIDTLSLNEQVKFICYAQCVIVGSFNMKLGFIQDLSIEVNGASIISDSFNNFDPSLNTKIIIRDTYDTIKQITRSFNFRIEGQKINIIDISDCRSIVDLSSSFRVPEINNLFLENLPSLQGIQNSFSTLHTVKNAFIVNTQLRELGSLQEISGTTTLIIDENPYLMEINFEGVIDCETISIQQNYVLTSATFLNLDSVKNLNVVLNGLNQLSLPNVTFIGDLAIVNQKFRTPDQIYMPKLAVGKTFNIVNNANLESLYFLESLTSITFLTSVGNKIRCNGIPPNIIDIYPQYEDIDCCGDGIVNHDNNEFCDDPDTCQNSCEECSEGFFGSTCEPCRCDHGFCDYGKYGTGDCLNCDENYFGKNCSSECTCQKGQCNSDINGDGLCLKCFTNYYSVDTNCENYCFCGQGTCDERTGVCYSCDEGYFGTNCHVAVRTDRPINPILNCAEFTDDETYIAYLGYSNIGDDAVATSEFYCGDDSQILIISEDLMQGQNNFQWKIENCTSDIIWDLNGMQIVVSITEIRTLSCNRTNQQFVFSLDNDYEESQLQQIRMKLSERSGIDSSRINIEKLAQSDKKRQDEVEIRVYVTSDETSKDSQELIMSVSTGEISLTDISSEVGVDAELSLTVHTFNETVGSTVLTEDGDIISSNNNDLIESDQVIIETNFDNLIVVIVLAAVGIALVVGTIMILISPTVTARICPSNAL